MTPAERAEDIKKTLLPLVDLGPSIIEFIAAQIQEVQAEAYDEANKDFDWLQSAVGKVYCALTDNKLSKWNTDPDLLIAEVEDIQNTFWEEEIEKARTEGYADARAQAAEIVQAYISPIANGGLVMSHITERIRKMEPR